MWVIIDWVYFCSGGLPSQYETPLSPNSEVLVMKMRRKIFTELVQNGAFVKHGVSLAHFWVTQFKRTFHLFAKSW